MRLLIILLSFVLFACDDNQIGDELPYKISNNYKDWREITYYYQWDNKKISYVEIINKEADTRSIYEFSYPNENEIVLQYDIGGGDHWGKYNLYHNGEVVDSIHYHGGSWAGEPYTIVSIFDHHETYIREKTTQYLEYTEQTSEKIIIWTINSAGQNETYKYKYDNKVNPFANSFIEISPFFRTRVWPIKLKNNFTKINHTTISYTYLKNNLPKTATTHTISGVYDETYQYSY